MNLNYKVKALSGNPNFAEGTELDLLIAVNGKRTKNIEVDGEVTTEDYLEVETELQKTFSNGWIKQYIKHEFPLAVLGVFSGALDPDTLLPTVNLKALNGLLKDFRLELE